jgi:hypothetical protein
MTLQLPSLRPLDELPLLQHLELYDIPTTIQTLTGVIGELPSLESLKLYGGTMRDILYNTKPAGTDSSGFLPSVEQRSLSAVSAVKSTVGRVLGRY